MLLIRNGDIVTENAVFPADILVEDGRIAAIGQNLPAPARAEVIDAAGCYVLPGVIDPHVHIQLDTGVFRTADDWETGTATAALGGVTTVIDFATQFPHQTAVEGVAARHREVLGLETADVAVLAQAEPQTPHPPYIDYALHCMLTVLPDEDDELDGWMEDLREAGVSAIKIYTTYRPNYYQDDAALLRSMTAAARAGLVVMVHAENDAMVTAATQRLTAAGKTSLRYHGAARPPFAEVEAAHRVLFLADQARAELYIVHNSVGRTVELIHAARQRGQRVWSETCPQYLLLDERKYEGQDAWRFIMQPPLRDPFQPAHLWQLLASGQVQALGTDHCDYTQAQKLGLRPLQDASLARQLAALGPGVEAVITARFGLFDGRPRTHEETAHYLNLPLEQVLEAEQTAFARIPELPSLAMDLIQDLQRLDPEATEPRLPFTQTPGGLPGLQTALPLMVTYGVMEGRITWSHLVRLMSGNPARIFRLDHRKGALRPGLDADIVIYDPQGEHSLTDGEQATIGGFTPYRGMKVRGRVRDTLVRGAIIVRDGELVGPRGWGRYIPSRPARTVQPAARTGTH
jgi:dihydropyrimidinase